MKKHQFLLLACLFFGFITQAQYQFSGYIDKDYWEGNVYLSLVEDYRKISGVYPEQIISKTSPDSTGYFSFTGNNLLLENRIYKIHVDTCLEDDPNTSHFTGHCPNSKEVLFVANNKDKLSLPFTFENEMFCRVVSKNEKANAFIQIDSVKSDMRYAFGTYRSEANRKINSKKWFTELQQYGEQLNEPLAELYIYAFLSDRTNDLHSYYLEDLKTNSYYDGLRDRLKLHYPETSYVQQYTSELASDRFLINGNNKEVFPWWIYLLGIVSLVSILGNLYFFRKVKNLKTNLAPEVDSLSRQEQKILDLIIQDKTNKEIATELFLSVSTVKTHINNLYKKLKVSSRDEVKSLIKGNS